MNKFIIAVISIFLTISVYAQQKPLPDFYATYGPRNSVLISWVNNFGDDCIQLNVQRSTDSINGFRTIFSTPAPELPSNGFTDKTAPVGRVFYKIFYMLNGGAYYFTVSKQPETAQGNTAALDANKDFVNPTPSKETATQKNGPQFKPLMVSLNSFGNVLITLPTDDIYRYTMKIWGGDNGDPLFSINHFTDKVLVLDKSSFLKYGRYRYAIYDGDKKVEENYFNLSK